MTKPRKGCLIFGAFWALLFLFTNFGLALGHPVDPDAIEPLSVLFWVEIAALFIGGYLFYRADMKDGEF